MKDQGRAQEKKMKIAEAGILFTLILGLTIFLGVHYSGSGDDPAPVVATAAVQVPVEPEIPMDIPAEAPADTQLAATPVPEPGPRIVSYEMAEQAYHQGDYHLAAELFTRYTSEHDQNAWGFYMLGLSQWKAGELEQAEAGFQAALALVPDHQKSLVNYSRVLLDMNRADDARRQVELALAQEPDDRSALRVLGRVQHEEGQLDEAVATYEKILRTTPDDAWSLNNLGLVLIDQGLFDEALPPLAKAASLRNDVACIQNNLGVALERNGYFRAAEEAYTRALDDDDSYAKSAVSLARLSDLVEAEGTGQPDLAALAENFSVESELAAEDMEVAATSDLPREISESSTTENVTPEADDSRNR